MTPRFTSPTGSPHASLTPRSHAAPLEPADRDAAVEIETVAAHELPALAPVLAELLADVVEDSTLGFVAPVEHDEALRYFLSLHPSLESGARVLVVARDRGRIVASGQLALSQWPNGRHRAEVQKVFVARSHQGRGIAKRLMRALHQTARDRGLSLLTLGTKHGSPAAGLYERLGYTVAGVVPGFVLGPTGERLDSVTMYLELE